MSTFPVSDVAPSREPLPSTTFDVAALERLGSSFEAGGANLGSLVGNRVHPFVGAADHAFCSHYPLVLSPDDVWLCIAQGFATHVDANAEVLRGRFVRHQGKVRIQLRRDEFVKGSPDNDWPSSFAEFAHRIANHVGKTRDLVVADFSTTGPVEKAASEVVLMAAMRHYFEYGMKSACGIPGVTLLGTADDWRAIRRRAAVLGEYGLEWWVDALLPMLDELERAATGRPDATLWRSFYKSKNASGGPYVNGWINVLFPYIGAAGAGADAGAPVRNRAVLTWAQGFDAPFGGGPAPEEYPSGLSVAPFLWDYLGDELPMELVAGFVGVSQDPQSLAVRPAIGWAVRDA